MPDKDCFIFAINLGSTSSKIAAFRNQEPLFLTSITNPVRGNRHIQELLPEFERSIRAVAAEHQYDLSRTDVFVARGGAMYPCAGGIYEVNANMLEGARHGPFGEHPARLACQIIDAFRTEYGGRACVVDPPDTDELLDIARFTGMKDVYVRSGSHALNQKAVARSYAASVGKTYQKLNLIVAHLGGGISISTHREGLIVDTNDLLNSSGPFTPTRCGDIPTGQLIDLCFSGKYSHAELKARTFENGGLMDLLGESDLRVVEKRIAQGDAYAKVVLEAMIYAIAKTIAARAVPLRGKVDQIILTGGMARDSYLTKKITEYVAWIAPVTVVAGEYEMEALAAGAWRLFAGEEQPKEYSGKPNWDPIRLVG